ncbi:acetyltransferase [Campylobacter fetus subsp. testudinum]|uniref:Acetyltransferase n=1 Tax=Campylobacter fetus subsp. testudinum TaxID=1507806 RepID=A0AAX0HBC9_CAMFE|nr:MBOAT family O-acyltransferase [Campylobacter fetus]OCR90596.1 acetyltransferase [Campylobacter fetus subsp. testudinum]
MLFNSFEFIFIFLPITFFLYFLLSKFRLVKVSIFILTAASLVFYGYWNFIYVSLILMSITFNFFAGNHLCKEFKFKKIFLWFSILCNLALLGYYKYTDFFIENFNGMFGSNIPLHHIILPLGISFFTFTQIAFLVDCFSGKVKETNYLKYALFVTYFPHLLAGPIIHHAEMMPQFANLRRKKIHYKNISIGIFLFAMGLFKKVVIADFFAKFANYGFDTVAMLSMSEAWITSLSYTFQLYFDFSGYTDMAIGISYMFNIVLPLNFNSPYKSLSIQEFWRRWHMTLSRFLRDYIYIPLGGNRLGESRAYINIFIVFLLGGLWHGAGWTFIIWGALHGTALMIHRFYSSHFKPLHRILAWIITFNFINITWVFFRAKDMESAFKVLKGMFNINSIAPNSGFIVTINEAFGFMENVTHKIAASLSIFIVTVMAFVICVLCKNSNEMAANSKFGYKTVIFVVFLFMCAFFATRSVQESQFLYFNF